MNYKIFYAWLQPFFGEHISCNLIRYHYCNVNYLAQLNITTSIKKTCHFQVTSTWAKLTEIFVLSVITYFPSLSKINHKPLHPSQKGCWCWVHEPSHRRGLCFFAVRSAEGDRGLIPQGSNSGRYQSHA